MTGVVRNLFVESSSSSVLPYRNCVMQHLLFLTSCRQTVLSELNDAVWNDYVAKSDASTSVLSFFEYVQLTISTGSTIHPLTKMVAALDILGGQVLFSN